MSDLFSLVVIENNMLSFVKYVKEDTSFLLTNASVEMYLGYLEKKFNQKYTKDIFRFLKLNGYVFN